MNLALTLLGAAERWPASEAIVDGAVRLTYAELLDRASRVAGGLAGLGVQCGDRVAAVLKNRVETVELLWACQWLGAWFVPLSWRSAVEDVGYCVRDSGASVVVYEQVAAEHAAALDGVRTIAAADASCADASAFDALRAAEPHPGALELDPRAIAIMLYTSGTTGRPKGVPRSHAAERAGGLAQALQHGYRGGERALGAMPLYHTMGDHTLLAMPLVGGTYVCQPDWSATLALELIESERLTSLYLAPTLFHDLVHAPERARRDVSTVRALAYAGAAMTAALAERCTDAFDPEVFVNHYGSTEIYTYSIDGNQRAKPGCAGRPSLNARLRLVRPEPGAQPDEVVGPGEEGEIACQLASDEAFGGYWNRPDADATAIRDGWYFTGDLGRLDGDGDLWIVGRVDDMIISGGENVHPLEVEDALARHPAVREAAVIGLPDDRWGQRVVACVVVEPGVGGEELDAFLLADGRLARFKRPREYRLVERLPRSPSGKILRRVLREQGSRE